MYFSGGGTPDVVRYSIVQETRGLGLDIGPGPFTAYPHFVGVRERGDSTMPPHVAPHYAVDSFDNLGDFDDAKLDFVFVHGPRAAPHRTHDSPFHREVIRVLKEGGRLIEAPGNEKSHREITFWKKAGDTLEPYFPFEADGDGSQKNVCIVRHGAIGDTLQATSILQALKNDGYHVTWMCEPSGHELLKEHPLIDRFLIQDKDQVPNNMLQSYWRVMSGRFNRWINLCESIEGTLVKLVGRADYNFPKAVRDELCNKNYLEFIAKIAQTPFIPEHYFYETEEEAAFATDYLASFSAQPVERAVDGLPLIGMKTPKTFKIMWALSGSSPDKCYPHMDAVIARILLEIPHAHIITAGDTWCQILEHAWENEPRVHRTAGEMEIRKTLAVAKRCDLVIGPDTGVLNAVAFESNAKIVLISHASPENLTKHWVNTETITNDITPCWPCHRLHNDHEFCPQEEVTGAAMCQYNNPPGVVWDAVQRAFVGRETVKRILTA